MAVDLTAVVLLTLTSGGPSDCLTGSPMLALTATGAFIGGATGATGTKAVEFKLRLNRSQFVAVT